MKRIFRILPALGLILTLLVALHSCGGGQPNYPAPYTYKLGKQTVTLNGDAMEGFPHTAAAWKADPASFKVLDAFAGYAKDKTNVYFRNAVIQGADPATFVVLARADAPRLWDRENTKKPAHEAQPAWPTFAKDKNRVYYRHETVFSADPASFTVLDAWSGYGKDANKVYYRRHVIDRADPATFSVLRDQRATSSSYNAYLRTREFCYAKDASQVFAAGLPLSLADPKTFTPLGKDGVYAKDAERLYLQAELLMGVKPDGLEYLGAGYAKQGNAILYLGTPLAGVDPATFKILGEVTLPDSTKAVSYAKDANKGFRDGNAMQIDQASFTIHPESGYAWDNKMIWYGNGTVYNATPATFKVLNAKLGYAADHSYVYYQSSRIEALYPKLFKSLSQTLPFVADDTYVFYKHQQIPGADPTTFAIITQDGAYVRDKSHVWFIKDGYTVKRLPAADPATFKVLDEENGISRDKNKIYLREFALNMMDAPTFTLLQTQPFLAKDKNGVYSSKDSMRNLRPEKITTLEGVDAASFAFISPNSSYARDKNRAYWGPMPLEGADSAKLTPLGKMPKSYNTRDFAHDGSKVYVNGVAIEGADAASFTLVDPVREYAKDANNVYYRDKIMAEADPATFTLIPLFTDDSCELDAYDKKGVWTCGKFFIPLHGPMQFQPHSLYAQDRTYYWVAGKDMVAFHWPFMRNITWQKNVKTDAFKIYHGSSYATDGEKLMHHAGLVKDADIPSFAPLPLRPDLQGGMGHDAKQIYGFKTPLHTLKGKLEQVWPPQGRGWDSLILKDGDDLLFAAAEKETNTLTLSVTPMTGLNAAKLRVLGMTRKEELITTDGEKVFFKGYAMSGVSPEGFAPITINGSSAYHREHFGGPGPRLYARTKNALIAPKLGRLYAVHKETKERHAIGAKGFTAWSLNDGSSRRRDTPPPTPRPVTDASPIHIGKSDYLHAFDGRFTIILRGYEKVEIWEGEYDEKKGYSAKDSPWELQGEEIPEGAPETKKVSIKYTHT